MGDTGTFREQPALNGERSLKTSRWILAGLQWTSSMSSVGELLWAFPAMAFVATLICKRGFCRRSRLQVREPTLQVVNRGLFWVEEGPSVRPVNVFPAAVELYVRGGRSARKRSGRVQSDEMRANTAWITEAISSGGWAAGYSEVPLAEYHYEDANIAQQYETMKEILTQRG